MSLNITEIAKDVSRWSGGLTVIAAALTKLYAAYRALEPTAKASLEADEQAVKAAWAMMDQAFTAYNAADDLSKLSAAMSAINMITRLTPLIGRIAADGETLFAADWPVLQPQVTIILNTLKGTKA